MEQRGSSSLLNLWFIAILYLCTQVSQVISVPSKGPNITTINVVNSTALTVTWAKLSSDYSNGNITKYAVCFDNKTHLSTCLSNKTIEGANTTMVVLTGLNEATTYYVGVRAGTKIGFGELGIVKNSTTHEDVPAKGPTIKNITSPTSTELTVIWNELSPGDSNGIITNYTVCYQLASSQNVSCTTNKVFNDKSTTVTLTGLNEATKYTVAVKAGTVKGFGDPGPEKNGTTLEDVPAKGPTIKTISPTSTSLEVVWQELSHNDGNGIITNYSVCYQVSSNKNVSCMNYEPVDGKTTTAALTGLNEATMYDVAVKASTAKGFGPLGPKENGTTLGDVPSKGPNITKINVINSTSLSVTWKKLSDDYSNGIITKYAVCYDDEMFSSFRCPSNKTVEGVNTTMIVLTGLNEATTYYIGVRASTVKGFGELGIVKNITTNEDKPTKGPDIEQLTAINSTALKVVWKELTSDESNGMITNYTVCYNVHSASKLNCSLNKPVFGGKNTMLNLTGLNEATIYDVAVKAATKIGFGDLGVTMNASTLEDRPTKGPDIEQLTTINSTALKVVWKELTSDESNGMITNYTVCYNIQSTSKLDCSLKKTVFGKNTMVNLTGLNEATIYDVAVKAATKIGFGGLGVTMNASTLEDRPAKGPDISQIIAFKSKLKVVWSELTVDDSNGIITKYEICYRIRDGPNIDCTLSENVTGTTTTVTLTGLKNVTTYNVAVKASTEIGFGDLGVVMYNTTLENIPSKPTIKSLESFLTKIVVTWEKPMDTNGVISAYEICWKIKNSTDELNCPSKKSSRADREYTIRKLKPGTIYIVTVKASTSAGYGPEDKKENGTVKSAIQDTPLKGKGVENTKTQIKFNLPALPPDESKEIKSLKVIIQKTQSIVDLEKLNMIGNNDVKSYENSEQGRHAYLTYLQKGYTNEQPIVIGNGSKILEKARRKRATTRTYQNAPLQEGTEYALFVRVFYDDDEIIYTNSKVLRVSTEKDEVSDGLSTAIVILIVILIIVILLVVVFGMLIMRRRKNRLPYGHERIDLPVVKVRNPIPVEDFRRHCERLGMNTGLGYQEEYENVKAKVPVSAEVAKFPENIDKNRYNNIHAFDETRVVLEKIEDEEGSDYVNANYIDGHNHKKQFIASQGPIKTTVVDFWRMIWEKEVVSIVMVANPVEKGKEKCAVYWPQDRAVKHGPFMIKLSGEVELADYVIRKLVVTKDDEKDTRYVTQFNYTVWPDHGVPIYTTSLQAFLTRIRKSVKEDTRPLLVHCSAGVGRTGTFIGIFAMMDRIEENQDVDIFNFVCQMRGQRTLMVQVESQYVFLHKAVLEAVECGDNEINAADLRLKMNQLNRQDPNKPDQTMMEKQFQVLNKYTYSKNNTEEGTKSYNVDKNRSKDILPYEDTRVTILKSPGVDGSDYINASFIDSYQKRGMYIATQFPLENTMDDFWRMVWEKKSNCIVMLANLEENAEFYPKYWTESNDALLCGNLLVTLESEEKADDFVTRNFKLKKTDGGETRNLYHFNFLSWRKDVVPENTVGIRQMIGKIQDVQRQSGNNPIVVHCSDGGGRTGAFCALVTSLERVKQDSSFNLFQTIMLQRIQRPKMVTSLDQYRFCFKAILDFLDSFDDYANFQDLRK